MSLGVLTAGCAVAKAILLQRVTADDITWDLNNVAIWAAIEQFLGIIITSIPMLRPLFSASHKSFHSWLRIRFNTQSHSSLRKNGSGSGSSPLVRSQPKQQIKGPTRDLRNAKKILPRSGACHGHSQADRSYYADPIHSIATEDDYGAENIPYDSKKNTAVTAQHLWSTTPCLQMPAILAWPEGADVECTPVSTALPNASCSNLYSSM